MIFVIKYICNHLCLVSSGCEYFTVKDEDSHISSFVVMLHGAGRLLGTGSASKLPAGALLDLKLYWGTGPHYISIIFVLKACCVQV